MNKKNIYGGLLIVIILSSVLRLWQIGKVPVSPDWDEVALGYNAYSIMETGRDEYGKFLPVVLRSFDDYKPALYAYLIIPFIKFFDLTVLTVRLPSAMMGIITVVATFFLTKELFPRFSLKVGKRIIDSGALALMAAFSLAISPWHLQFSRVAFESNVGLAFSVLGVLFFLKSLKKPWLFLLSVFFFALSVYTYQSNKVFTPLLFLSLLAFFRKEISLMPKKQLFIGIILGILTLLPIVSFTTTNKEAFSRAKGVSFLSDNRLILEDSANKIIRDKNNNDKIGLILDNRRVVYLKTVVYGYVSHFDLNWLFITGDFNLNRHHAPNMGLLYIVSLPFLFIGIFKLITGDKETGFTKSSKLLILAWFLIAPIPASITKDVPHAVRTLNFLPTFQIFIALGVITFISILFKIKYRMIRFVIIMILILSFGLNFLYYLNQYFIQQNIFYSLDWQYGYQPLIKDLKPIQNKYKTIFVSNFGELKQSYIFFLFYTKYNPRKYLAEGGTASGGFEEKTNKFANFRFGSIDPYKQKGKDILFIGGPNDFPEVFKEITSIKYLDGKTAIRVVENY